jgi:hypothetical protein
VPKQVEVYIKHAERRIISFTHYQGGYAIMRTERLLIFIIVIVLALMVITFQGCYSETLPDWAEGFEYKSNEIFPIYVSADGSAFVSATFGGEPVALLFNTGEPVGLSMTDKLVRQMGLEMLDSDPSDEIRYTIPAFTAFGHLWKDQEVVPASITSYNGSIGPQLMNGQRFTLDYGKQLMAVSESPLPEDLPGENVVPLVHIDDSLLPVVQGLANGEPVLIELDTGSSRTIVDMMLARKLGLQGGENGYQVSEVSIGFYKFEIKAADAAPLPITKDLRRIRLGTDVLSQMILTVDYLSGTVAIKPVPAIR